MTAEPDAGEALRNAGPWAHLTGTPCPHYIASRPRPAPDTYWWCTEHQQHVVSVAPEPDAGNVEARLAPMLADGFDHHEHEHFKPGVRVRNRGEQYGKARQFGTAAVVAVLRKPGSWERKWGRLNIEVLVRRDADGSLAWWADYGTHLAREEASRG